MERQKYTSEYKEQAVRLSFEPGNTVEQVATDLGINAGMLVRWRHEYRQRKDGQNAFPGSGTPRDAEMAALQRRVRELEMERDILKKAAMYFAQKPS
jgi:transposase-like protein